METNSEHSLALLLAATWARIERRLDRSLAAIRGISLAEYRLLHALGNSPGAQASRVELAEAVCLTPSGVTRALRPMEKLGIVSSVKSKRDARLSIAALTPAGRELLEDASAVVDETMASIIDRSALDVDTLPRLAAMLDDLGR